ncbi:MAG: MFS transporter [Anaerolineae bacterium]|nr:MFS transporter [Anaerolineae bacterium]
MKAQRTPVLILFAALVIVMLGFGIVVPIMPFYASHFGATGQALGFLMAIYSLMQFLFAPLWGRLSDRIGRKPVLLIGLLGYALSFTLQGFAQNFTQLFVARALSGVLSSATLPTALAFIADTTSAENRSGGMGMMGAAMGLGMIFGPMIGGPLTKVVTGLPPVLNSLLQFERDTTSGALLNLSLPFLAAALLALITVPIVIAAVPESLPTEQRGVPTKGAGPSRWALLVDSLRGPMAFLFVSAFLLAFALANFESVLGLFAKDQFGMSPSDVGMLMGLIGVLSVIQQGVVIGPLTKKIGEERVLQAGLIVSVIGFVGLAVFRNREGMILCSAFFNIGNALLRPSVASLISQRAQTGQGVAMGLENSFMSLGRATGPIVAGSLYDVRMTLPFWVGAAIQAVAFALSFRLMKPTITRPANAAVNAR